MKAYCINLQRRVDRRDHMWAMFDRLGMDVVRQQAVDGQERDVVAKADLCGMGRSGRHLSAGAYACLQSHRSIWERLVESNETHAMVLEDDLVLASDMAAYLTTDWIPADADLVRLETMGGVRVHLDRGHKSIVGGRYLARMRSSHMGTGCYVISRSTAPRLLTLTADAVDAIDEVLFDMNSPVFPTLKIYQMFPAPAIQGNRLSSVGIAQDWSHTSITDRFTPEEIASWQTPRLLTRVRRRALQELQSIRNGTRYVPVRYG